MKNTELQLYIIDLLSRLCPVLDEILIKNDNVLLSKDYRKSKIYLLEYLTRQSSNLNGIKLLFQINIPIRIEHSVGLLLRNSLSDLLYLYHLNINDFNLQNLNKEYFELEVIKICADQIVRTIKGREKDILDISRFDSFVLINKDNRVESKFEKPINNLEISKELKLKRETENFSNAFNLWEIYSKYEHFGLLSNFLQLRNNCDLYLNHFKSISFIVHGVYISLSNILSFTNETEIQQSDINLIYDFLNELTLQKIENQ